MRTKFSSEDESLDISSVMEAYASNRHLTINKTLLQVFGPESAAFISNLINKLCYFIERGKIKPNGWFYQTHKYQMEETGIRSDYLLHKCKVLFVNNGVLQTRMAGIPPKEFFHIDLVRLETLLTNYRQNFLRINRQMSSGIKDKEPKYKENKENHKNGGEIVEELITTSMFAKFWHLFPIKPDKGKALTAWKKLCKQKDRPTWKTVRMALVTQKKTKRWEKGYIPHPTTWLNQSRWLDDPVEMNKQYGNNGHESTSNRFRNPEESKLVLKTPKTMNELYPNLKNLKGDNNEKMSSSP
jgi:hypothetical protein